MSWMRQIKLSCFHNSLNYLWDGMRGDSKKRECLWLFNSLHFELRYLNQSEKRIKRFSKGSKLIWQVVHGSSYLWQKTIIIWDVLLCMMSLHHRRFYVCIQFEFILWKGCRLSIHSLSALWKIGCLIDMMGFCMIHSLYLMFLDNQSYSLVVVYYVSAFLEMQGT